MASLMAFSASALPRISSTFTSFVLILQQRACMLSFPLTADKLPEEQSKANGIRRFDSAAVQHNRQAPAGSRSAVGGNMVGWSATFL